MADESRSVGDLYKIWADTRPDDDDGWPPIGAEGLWGRALETPWRFVLENIPCWADDLAMGDEVEAELRDGRAWITRLVTPGGHSTLRAFVEDDELMKQLRSKIRDVGCSSELDKGRGVIAIDVPSAAAYKSVVSLLQEGEDAERWWFWDGAVRH